MPSQVYKILKGLDKYILLTFVGVIVIYLITTIGIELFTLKPQVTYFIATGINLAIAYFGYLFIFKQPPTKKNLLKYIINLLFFFILNNLLFHIWISQFAIHYLIAVAINLIIFPLAKFLSYRYLVFN